MKIGKVKRIIRNVPAPIIVRPQPIPQAIPAPNWPVKAPAKVPNAAQG